MNSYDAFKMGLHDENSPINQKDIPEQINEISQAICVDNLRALDLLSEVMQEINFLRDYAKANENQYLLKRLNSIYQKL